MVFLFVFGLLLTNGGIALLLARGRLFRNVLRPQYYEGEKPANRAGQIILGIVSLVGGIVTMYVTGLSLLNDLMRYWK